MARSLHALVRYQYVRRMRRHNLFHVPGRIEVARTGRVLAHEVVWARTWRARSQGLRGTSPGGDRALVLDPAKQIHTFGMTYPIDVLFCDREWIVKFVVSGLAPRRVTRIVWSAQYVVELPAGAADDVRPGDALRVLPG